MFNQPYILYINLFSHGIQTSLYVTGFDSLILLRIPIFMRDLFLVVTLEFCLLNDLRSVPSSFFWKKFVQDQNPSLKKKKRKDRIQQVSHLALDFYLWKCFFHPNSVPLFDMSQFRFSIFSWDIFDKLCLSRKFSILSKLSNLLASIFFRGFFFHSINICRVESNVLILFLILVICVFFSFSWEKKGLSRSYKDPDDKWSEVRQCRRNRHRHMDRRKT